MLIADRSSVEPVPETVADGILQTESIELESIMASTAQQWRKEGCG